MKKYHPLFIGGEWVEPAEGRLQEDIDPSTGEKIAEVAVGGVEDVDRAVAAAQKAYDEVWADTTPAERAGMLLKLADAIEGDAEELARLESIDVGKPISAAAGEVPAIVNNIRFFAGAARCLEGKSAGEYVRGYTSMIRRESLGVTVGVCPWNYPLLMAAWKLGPALAAGNTSILKPAQVSPLTTLRLAELASDIFPPGVLNVITGAGAVVGEALARHPKVRLLSVTGDTSTGVKISAAAAGTVKRLHLELGGKGPVVVFDDADPKMVAELIRVGGYENAGQDCSSSCRVLAGPKIYDALVSELVGAVETLKIGDTSDPETELGPLVSAKQRDAVAGFVDRAADGGASVVTGGQACERKGCYYEPTVVVDAAQDSEIVQREVFGPVVTVQRFEDEDQAVAWANDVDYGLTASAFTSDSARSLRMAKRLQFGCVWVNTHFVTTPEMPHGGFKQSGYGSDMSMYSLEDYTQVKHAMFAIG